MGTDILASPGWSQEGHTGIAQKSELRYAYRGLEAVGQITFIYEVQRESG